MHVLSRMLAKRNVHTEIGEVMQSMGVLDYVGASGARDLKWKTWSRIEKYLPCAK